MNRKISTLFTAGLLVAGSLCGSAWAQTIQDLTGLRGVSAANELKDGSKYLLVAPFSNEAYGHKLNGTTLGEFTKDYTSDVLNDKKDVRQFVWEVGVNTALGQTVYTFKNVETGKLLRIKKSGSSVGSGIENNTTVDDANTYKEFAFEASISASTVAAGKYSSSNKYLYVHEQKTSYSVPPFGLDWSSGQISTTSVVAPKFYEVKSENFMDADELNALYNTSGFSFVSKRKDPDQGDVEPEYNLFNGKRVVARYISSKVEVDATKDPSYSGSNKDMYIPKGMYFFTENAPKEGSTNYKDWMNATILVVSSTETVEQTATGRALGDGFRLVEKKVSDLNFYQGTDAQWLAEGDEISINNAKFNVQRSYVDDYPYELNIPDFRFRVQPSKTAQMNAKDVADNAGEGVKMWVLKHNDKYYLTTVSHKTDDANQFIFKLGLSGMKKGIDLLNSEAKVSAYTIRILGGKEYTSPNSNIDKKDIKSAYGKYLTNDVESSAFKFAAKAKVLSQLEAPAYQWAITSVDDDYTITFTNRETGEYFVTGLFPMTDLGENVYELAISKTSQTKEVGGVVVKDGLCVDAIYVDENTYNETEEENVSLQQMIVELTPVEVDPMAGFWEPADETLVTMAFARDNNETSNKWYAAVTDNGNTPGTASYTAQLNKNGKFADKVYDAAQWQLVKGIKRTIIERSFVYNKDGRVTVQARGDKGYAYSYQLQYIHDGIETEKYFPLKKTLMNYVDEESQLVSENTANFIIKKAVDGSVYLIEVDNTTASLASILDENTKSVVYATYDSRNNECEYKQPNSVYVCPNELSSSLTHNDWMLRTYLLEEAPEISYPAEEGHISLISEMNNYISMNEDRDGIVVNENQYSFYLQVTDEDAVVPSFYISNKGTVEDGDRLFLFNPKDSVNYYVADGTYDRKYQWNENDTKAIFKPATLLESKDTLTTIVKGNKVSVAEEADDEGVLGGLDCFKVQIIQCEDDENAYRIRSVANKGSYLYSVNDKLSWSGDKSNAMRFTITAGDPTSNESIADATEGIKVIAGNGMIEIQGAAGKMVSVT
ncbi:DUF6383 domain-containing protein, partial [uncultured Parabacteroides sp.]|uniref:DUF6383 domain-containing protein n=1 Tax=uncultured Parabacteroides sp. TaxID=512312 RepID=UPI002607491F